MTHPYTRLLVLPAPPDADNDVTEGYELGDVVHVIGGSIYDCRDATEGVAVWEERGAGGSFDGNVTGMFRRSGIITTALTGDHDDWEPTGIATASVIRVTSGPGDGIFGMAGGVDGRIITLLNVNTDGSSFLISSEQVSSLAGNRFDLPANVILTEGKAISFIYDGSISRWIQLDREWSSAEISALIFANISAEYVQDISANMMTGGTRSGITISYNDVGGAVNFEVPANQLLMNGDLQVWQRGNSWTSIADGTRVADNFKYSKAGTVVHDVTRDTDVPTVSESGHKSNYSIKLDVTTVDASIAAGDFSGIQVFVEGHDYAAIKDSVVTLSFWVKAVKTGIYCIAFRNNANDRSYIMQYTIDAANTWEKKAITLTLNPTGGTDNYTSGLGLSIFFTQACGTTFQTTIGAWQTGNFLASSSQVNGTDNTSNNFWLSQIKLEKTTGATAFKAMSFHEVLEWCQTQFFKTFEYDTVPATSAGTSHGVRWPAPVAGTGAHKPPSFIFPVKMRIAPTITYYNPSVNNAQARDVGSGTDCSATTTAASSDTLVDINCTGNAATAVGNSIIVCFTAEAGF